MNKIKKIMALVLCAVMVCSCIPVMAGEDLGPTKPENKITSTTEPGRTPVELELTGMQFSVTVPSDLSVTVSNDGAVTVSDKAKIINNGAGPVVVKSVRVEKAAGWTLVGDFADLSKEKVGAKKFSFQIKETNVAQDGTCAAVFDRLEAKNDKNDSDEVALPYNAHIAPQNKNLTNEKIADIVIVVAWDEQKQLISFTIDGTLYNRDSKTYYAEADMTWEQWINNSEYNTDGMEIYNGLVSLYPFFVSDSKRNFPKSSDQIIEGEIYIFGGHDGSGSDSEYDSSVDIFDEDVQL